MLTRFTPMLCALCCAIALGGCDRVDKAVNYASRPPAQPERAPQRQRLRPGQSAVVEVPFDPDHIGPKGLAALELGVREGFLRRAEQRDADAWLAARKEPKAPPSLRDTYVVLKAYRLPPGLIGNGKDMAYFYVPRDVPAPSGNNPLTPVYDSNTGYCAGKLCDFVE